MNSGILIAILTIFLIFSPPIYAKPKPQPHHTITTDEILAKMKKQLELTEQQFEAVKPIVEDYLAKEQALKLEEKKQLSKVLTGSQMYTWNFLQNESTREKKKKSVF